VFYRLDFLEYPEYGFCVINADEPKVVWLEKENWSGDELEKEKNKL
jgi:hypothetical protein